MDAKEFQTWITPILVWLLRKGLTYGVTAVVGIVGVKEGYSLEWVIPASVCLGGILSVVTSKLVTRWINPATLVRSQ